MTFAKRGSSLGCMLSHGGIRFTRNTFRPAEAAEVTGLSAMMQRDWRERGYLPKSDGHARYDVFDIARMYIMRVLSERGIGPKISIEYAQSAANSIVYHRISTADSYEFAEQYLSNQSQIDDIRSSLIDAEYRTTYMIWWSDFTAEFCNDIGEAFSWERPSLKGRRFLKQDGPVIVLNLEFLSARLCLEPRPFLRLLPPEEPTT